MMYQVFNHKSQAPFAPIPISTLIMISETVLKPETASKTPFPPKPTLIPYSEFYTKVNPMKNFFKNKELKSSSKHSYKTGDKVTIKASKNTKIYTLVNTLRILRLKRKDKNKKQKFKRPS